VSHFTFLTDLAGLELLGILVWLPDRTIIIYISRLRHASGTTFMSTAGQLLHIAPASGALVFTVYSVYLG